MRFCCLSLFILLSHLLSGQSPLASVQSIVQSFRDDYKVPAIAASVIRSDTILYGLAGKGKIESDLAVKTDDLFHLGSNTKAVSAALAAKLVEEGKIRWEDKLLDIIPELRNAARPAYAKINLEDLLSHRALIQPFESDRSAEWKGIPSFVDEPKRARIAFATYALSLQPVSLGQNKFFYSNGGYVIAAAMLEAVSGKSWEDLVDTYFSEIGLQYHIGFPSQSNLAHTFGHKKRVGSKKYRSVGTEGEYPLEAYFAPMGNLSMSIQDFSSYIQLHLQGLQGMSNSLSAKTYQKLHVGFEGYALGWYNGKIGDTDQLFSYHGGSLGTYSSAVMLSPDRNIAIIILVNADDKHVSELKNKLRVALWEQYGRP